MLINFSRGTKFVAKRLAIVNDVCYNSLKGLEITQNSPPTVKRGLNYMTTRTLRRTNIGHSKSVEALMVHIDWTDSRVVRIEARKDFTLAAHTVKVLHDEYSVLADVPVNVKTGQVLYFVESKDFHGWYYVLTYNEIG